MLKDLVYNCRSYRRFYEDVRISDEELKGLVDLARMTPSTANSQALKFKVVNSPEENALVYIFLRDRYLSQTLSPIARIFPVLTAESISIPPSTYTCGSTEDASEPRPVHDYRCGIRC